MKKNISVIVVFGLLLAFGMLVASCDNGVLPKYIPALDHGDGEYGANNPIVAYLATNLTALIPATPPTPPPDTSAWDGLGTTIYLDFFTGAPTMTLEGINGTLPGDGTADAVGGTDLVFGTHWGSGSAASLVGTDVIVGGVKTPWKFRAAADSTKPTLKIAP